MTETTTEPEAVEAWRGECFSRLDRLAFALEMEAAELVSAERLADAESLQATRLGVRLAQRLVSGVPSPEVDGRLGRWEVAYLSRLAPAAS